MKYKILGNTGLKVSELCLGTMTFGGKGMWTAIGTLGQEHVDELVKGAIDGGINFIDTANVYSEGLSEELTGKAIKNLGLKRDDLIIATKVRGKMGEGPNDSGLPANIFCLRWKVVLKDCKLIISTCTRFTASMRLLLLKRQLMYLTHSFKAGRCVTLVAAIWRLGS